MFTPPGKFSIFALGLLPEKEKKGQNKKNSELTFDRQIQNNGSSVSKSHQHSPGVQKQFSPDIISLPRFFT